MIIPEARIALPTAKRTMADIGTDATIWHKNKIKFEPILGNKGNDSVCNKPDAILGLVFKDIIAHTLINNR